VPAIAQLVLGGGELELLGIELDPLFVRKIERLVEDVGDQLLDDGERAW